MDKLIITGVGGFFASRFVDYFRDKYEIYPLSRRELDITDEKQVSAIVSTIKPKYFVHAAAISDTGVCEQNEELSYQVNVLSVKYIAKACNDYDCKLIYLSSEQVYNGNPESGPYSEDIQAIPNTVYGKHKLQAESEVVAINKDSVILRLTWMFSFPERNKKTNPNIVFNVLKAILKNEKISLPSNEYRGISYVYEVIEQFDKILNLKGGIYNTGSENDLSTYQIGCEVLKAFGMEHRTDVLLHKDINRYKDKARDLRITNKKMLENGISFSETKDAVRKCIQEFGFNIKV